MIFCFFLSALVTSRFLSPFFLLTQESLLFFEGYSMMISACLGCGSPCLFRSFFSLFLYLLWKRKLFHHEFLLLAGLGSGSVARFLFRFFLYLLKTGDSSSMNPCFLLVRLFRGLFPFFAFFSSFLFLFLFLFVPFCSCFFFCSGSGSGACFPSSFSCPFSRKGLLDFKSIHFHRPPSSFRHLPPPSVSSRPKRLPSTLRISCRTLLVKKFMSNIPDKTSCTGLQAKGSVPDLNLPREY